MPQLVEEADAIQLWNLLPDAPEDEKPQMAAIIRRYEEQETTAGRTPYAGYQQQQIDRAQKVRRLYTDKLHGMETDQFEAFSAKLAGTRDPDAVKYDIFNSEFLAPQYGARPQDIDGRLPHLMQDYAQKRWNISTPLSGGQFAKMVKSDYELSDTQGTAVLNGAVSGQTTPASWEAFKAANINNPTWNPARERERAKQFYLQSYDLSVKAQALQPVADQVETALSSTDSSGGIRQIVPLFSSLSNFEAGLVMTMLEQKAKSAGDKSIGEQTMETAYRTLRDIWRQGLQFADESALDRARGRSGWDKDVPESIIKQGPESIVDNYLLKLKIRAQENIFGELRRNEDGPRRALSEEEQKKVAEVLDGRIAVNKEILRLQGIHDQIIDPVKAQNWFTREYYYPAVSSGAIMVNALIPGGVGLVANFAYYAKEEKDRYIGLGVDRSTAHKIGVGVGAVQAALDKVGGEILIGKFPITRRVMLTPAPSAGGQVARFGATWAFNTIAETGIDIVQSKIVPALVQDLSGQGGAVAWLGENGVWQQAWDAVPETAAPMLLLGLVGATASGVNDFQQARTLLQNEHLLTAYIENQAHVAEIRTLAGNGNYSEAAAKFRQYAAPALQQGVTLSVAGKEALKTFAEQTERQQAAAAQLVTDGIIPDMRRTQDGWQLRYRDGSTADFEKYEDADTIRWQAPQAETLRIHESVREALRNAERNLAPGTGVRAEFTNEHVTTDRRLESLPESEREKAGRQFEQRGEIEKTFMDEGQKEQQEHATATTVNAATAPDAQTERAVMTILGESSNEYVDGIYTNVVKLNLGHTALTVTEETLESDAKKLLAGGQRALILEGLRDTEAKTGQKWLRTKDDSKVEDQDLIEGFSNLGVAMFVGESQAGHERGKANRRWLNSYQRNIVRQTKLGRLLDAFALKMAAVFRRAKAVTELRGKGEFHKGLEAELARGLGLEQRQHEAGVVKEAASLAQSAGGRSYSVISSPDDSEGMGSQEGPHSSGAGGHRDRSRGNDPDLFESTARELGRGKISHPRGLEDGPALKSELDRQVAELEKRSVEPPDEDYPHMESGGEHAVYKAGNKAQKLTLPGFYGYVADENDMFMNPETQKWGGLELRPALPSEYLMRWSLMKSVFGVPADLIRFEEHEEGPLVVIHQPWIEGLVPSGDEIEVYMKKNGFRRVDDKLVRARDQQGFVWYRDKDNILAADVRPRNFRKTTGNHIIPIDLMLSVHPQGDFFTFSMAAGELPFRLAKLFDPFQRNPELRQKVALEAQRRVNLMATELEQATATLPALTSQGLNIAADAGDKMAAKRLAALTELEAGQTTEIGGARTDGADPAAIDQMRGRHREQRKALFKQWRTQDAAVQSREKLLSWMRVLDSALSALPAEVRGKVGGYIQLAKFKTDEARLGEIERRVQKMDKEMEKWLRSELDDQFQKILKRAEPKKDQAGKKRVGKLGADVHDLFFTLKAAMNWTIDEASAHVAGLETAIASGNLTPEQEAHALLEASLVPQMASWKDADATRRAGAVENARYALDKGYAEYKLKKLRQKEDRQIAQSFLKADTGKAGTPEERNTRANQENGWLKTAERWTLPLLNFDQAMRWVFGDKSTEAKRLSDLERKAANAKEDALQAKQREVEDLFTQLGGDKYKGEQLRWRMSQPSLTAQGLHLSEFEGMAATMMWMQEDGQRHMIGKLDENGKPVGPWHYDQAFIDEIEAALSPEAKAVRSFLMKKYASEYSKLNPIYRELNGINLPSHKNYSPLTVKPQQAQAGQVVDPVTGMATSAGSITPGSLRNRNSAAIAEPNFRDALQTYLAHTAQMEHWMAYAPFVAEAQAILGNRELNNSVEVAAGNEAVKILGAWVDVFNVGGTRDAANQLDLNKGFAAMSNRAATMALIGRLGTIAVQSTQLTAAMAEMPTGAYAIRLGKLFTGNLGWKAALDSPYIQRRMNQMPPIVRQGMEGLRANKPNQLKHQVAKLGTLISGADALFTAGTYAIVHDYQMSQLRRAGITGLQAEELASQAAERITDALAQPTRLGTRSLYENRSTNVWMRLSWNFASDARKNLALMLYNGVQKPWPQKVRTMAAMWFIGSAAATLIRTAWRDARDDDDEDVFDERHWNPVRLALATLTSPLQGLPVVGSITEAAVYELTGEYLPEGNLFSGVRQGAGTLAALPKYLEGQKDLEDALKDAESLMTAVGYFNDSFAAGTSVMHIIRDAFGLAQNVEGED